MRVLLFFIDGFGLGADNPETNPLARFGLPSVEKLFGNSLTQETGAIIKPDHCLIPIDATLGVEGLPQSATGQAALLTGLNTARIMGRHIQAFPGPELSKIIVENNLMRKLAAGGVGTTSANLYLPNYFDLVAARKRRHSAITLAALSTGMTLRSLNEVKNGYAVYQDITNEMLPAFGINDVQIITPRQAAQNLVNISRKYSFTIFEYFQTDRAGHKQNWQAAQNILEVLNEFISSIYELLYADTYLLVTSDHGNFEDMSVKTHTLNKIPFIAIGCGVQHYVSNINELTEVAPTILQLLRKDEPRD